MATATPAKSSVRKSSGKGAARKSATGKARANGRASAGAGALPWIGAALAGVGAIAALLMLGRSSRFDPDAPAPGHPAPDLERADHPDGSDRADPHFRPDMDAPMSAADRAALAPALANPVPPAEPILAAPVAN
ncbi:hypothetical protein ACPVPU_05660 [Sphingomonas sp. CJ99]